MKVCPKCNQSYNDPDLNFCLNDGEFLTDFGKDDAPPTIFMDPTRTTNPNTWQPPPVAEPLSVWQNQQSNLQNQPAFQPPPYYQSPDQVLPTVALVLGILSLLFMCCYGGIWLGIPAAIVGYLGMRNAENDPSRYGGRGLAIAGLALGIVSLVIAFFFIFFGILGNFL